MAYSTTYGDMHRAFRNFAIQDGYSEDPEGSGLKYATLDLRTTHRSVKQAPPKVTSGMMWTDEDFPPSRAVTGCASETLVWYRPHNFLQNPQLFVHGTERFDVKQKGFGTCWFLSMLSNLADKPRLLKKVINTGSYTPRKDGICHCKLWKFGEWVDIYIDDSLPLYRGRAGLELYGAMSLTAPNELWVSLVEKAVAKMYGSYCVVDGGWPSDAYLALTGGVSETVPLASYTSPPDDLFRRLDKALETGAMVTCVILGTIKEQEMKDYAGKLGLLGPHAYALNKTAKVQRYNGEVVCLIRIRNPHGKNEWTGKWSDQSSEWDTLAKGKNLRRIRDEGEFWMELSDFMQRFTQTTICSMTVDFDKDGQSDPLNYVLRIFGEWGTEVTVIVPNICKKPEFSDKYRGLTPEGTVPVVVQVIQDELRHDSFSKIGCGVLTGDDRTRIPDIEGKPRRSAELQRVFRYNLSPGTYILRPSRKHGTSKEFLVRVFSPCPIHADKY
ncbi:calpain-1 catalytic subunit-like isoform X1 [Haliotis rubra]|uniref:calpain-1 catalytic subunit-like isoform X1 n=1 Tax=Haliotis rubra TaxID=36100 RepID=UPI001EE5C85B|nr:calpain-1 catalytic subunit-like isoform X1 [Haliotis rubra]